MDGPTTWVGSRGGGVNGEGCPDSLDEAQKKSH